MKKKSTRKYVNKGRSPKTKPGVLNVIETQLFKAKAKGGVSKAKIVSIVQRKFPDRDPKSVQLTVNTQVSGRRLENRGIKIVSKRTNDGVLYFAKGKPTVKIAA